MTNREALRKGVAYLLGAILVGVLAWRMPWRDALSAIRIARPSWWSAALVVGGLGIMIRTLRLWLILGTHVPPVVVWRALALGYAGALALPAGGGELVKLGVLTRQGGRGLARTTAAIFVDRLMDIAGLGVGIALLSQLQTLPNPMGFVLKALGWLFLVLGLGMAALLFRGQALHKWLEGSQGITGLRPKLAQNLLHLIEVVDNFRSPKFWIQLTLLQAFALFVDATSARLLMEALPMSHLPWWSGLQVGCLAQMAFALPLLPGAVGAYQAACILALRPFGIGLPHALAYSLLGHLSHVLVVVGNGAAAAFTGRNITKPRIGGPG